MTPTTDPTYLTESSSKSQRDYGVFSDYIRVSAGLSAAFSGVFVILDMNDPENPPKSQDKRWNDLRPGIWHKCRRYGDTLRCYDVLCVWCVPFPKYSSCHAYISIHTCWGIVEFRIQNVSWAGWREFSRPACFVIMHHVHCALSFTSRALETCASSFKL